MNSDKHALISFVLILCCAWSNRLRAQDADMASKIYAENAKSVYLLVVKSADGEFTGQGTGFLVQGGKIVTNEHVVRNGTVYLDLGSARFPTTVEKIDAHNDLAVLATGAELSTKPLVLAAGVPTPGTSIYAIGNPAGLERTISTGVVSGIRESNRRQLLQITSPISPGSSGGPIFNVRGEVVGVAVGMFENGQNLNFAVPVAFVSKLLRGEVSATSDVPFLMERVDALQASRDIETYSADSNSEWQKLDRQIDSALQSALESAGNNADYFLKISEKATTQNPDIAITAAERALRIKTSVEGNLALAQSLKWKALFLEGPEKSSFLERSEKAIRAAFRTTKQPTTQMYYLLADVLEDRQAYTEAEANFRRVFDLSKITEESDMHVNSIRGLIRVSYALKKAAEGETWFKALIKTGKASAYDWRSQGQRFDALEKYNDAGKSFQQAALLGGVWTDWCEAAWSFAWAQDQEDATLSCARKCISEGAGKKDSELQLARAHNQIAQVLNGRGVYQEGLSHAKEASTLNASDAWNFNSQAVALLGLSRFQEAINAANQAIRLSDGKFSVMHFELGSAYFSIENWEFAKRSFEKAAELSPGDSAAPYNVALCLARLGFYRDAATWYEEVLRRSPRHPRRQDILKQIEVWRQ